MDVFFRLKVFDYTVDDNKILKTIEKFRCHYYNNSITI